MTWLRYVPHSQMLQFLARGWTISNELHGTSHGAYSVLMQWSGDHEPA